MNELTASEMPVIHRANRNAFVQWFGRTMLKLMGWTLQGEVPPLPKFIIVGAPHTSNWDFIIAMLVIMALDVKVHWIAKHTIFKKPFDKLLYRLGGVPLDRNRPEGVVEGTAKLIRDSDQMVIAMMPEGTRNRVDRFKTGFLRIAKAADCPVKLVGLDYRHKIIVFDKQLDAAEDINTQVVEIKNHYQQNFTPKCPENF
jgi:1-acyl-sn-glycerol-3-phosphate acyltransferase